MTGGLGYMGMGVVDELLARGHDVKVLDSALHGQLELIAVQQGKGVRVIEGDLRSAPDRAAALEQVDAVVHLAAIVGDPACATSPEVAQAVNVHASKALAADAAAAGVERFLMASTCSNYGRMNDPETPINETGPLAPVSLYAAQKVEVELHLLGLDPPPFHLTCLRFATVYGAAPRMRFDLTVNEFTRDLWADRRLEVFGERFWRPYVHVHDAARAILAVLEAPPETVAGEVLNVGDSDENYRKVDLVELIRTQVKRGDVVFVPRDEDPRDYKVSFAKIRARLGFEVEHRVPDGIADLVDALDSGRFPNPFDARYRNTP